MASNCDYCSSSDLDLVETLGGRRRSKVEENLQSCLSKEILDVNVGAGSVEKLPFDEANKRYLNLYFPDLDKNSYCCPPVKDYRHPRESLEFGARKVNNDTLEENRRADLAEVTTIEMFSAMFRKYEIPSFIIHGYKWKQKYLKVLRGFSKKVATLTDKMFASIKDGEMDLLITLPSRCLFSMEVKSVAGERPKSDISGVVTKAFSQCTKMVRFLSATVSLSKPVSIIKVVVLPNCTKSTINQLNLCCTNCRSHIISSDDLISITTLNHWLEKITSKYSETNHLFPLESSMHSDIVGRLIGPASLTRLNTASEAVQRTVDQITDDQETLDIIREQCQWFQLSPEQLYAKSQDPQFMLLYGPPGSGKTLLALSKAEEILTGSVPRRAISTGTNSSNRPDGNKARTGGGKPENSVPVETNTSSVLYILVGNKATELKKMYGNKLQNVPKLNCELIIEEHINNVDSADMALTQATEAGYRDFLCTVKEKKERHPGKIVHILFDETRIHPFTSEHILSKSIVDKTKLGYLWLMLDPGFVPLQTDEAEFYAQTGFHRINLDYVMRMSIQNIEFVNMLLPTIAAFETERLHLFRFKSGHAISGLRPSVYRLHRCICTEPPDDFCSSCSSVRYHYLRKRVEAELDLKCVAVITPNNESVETLQEHKIFPSPNFRGCEHYVVINDLSSLCYRNNALSDLTRSMAKIVILAIGCDVKDIPKYNKLMKVIDSAVESGKVEMNDINLHTVKGGDVTGALIDDQGNTFTYATKVPTQ